MSRAAFWGACLLGGLFLTSPAAAKFSTTESDIAGPCRVAGTSLISEVPPADCLEAIGAAKDDRARAVLYFAWAYSLNEAGKGIAAIPYLDKAIAAVPDFVTAWHERGYTNNDLGFYEKGLADLTTAVALAPDEVRIWQERSFSYHRLARFSEELADIDRVIAMAGNTPARSSDRASALAWLGRYEEAALELSGFDSSRYDEGACQLAASIARRQAFQGGPETFSACTLENLAVLSEGSSMVDACSWAFDHEPEPSKRGEFLTVRASARIVAENRMAAGMDDYAMAAAIDPENPQRHVNYGFSLISARHSWAARNEFARALASPSLDLNTRAYALGGRALANYNLADKDAAIADAKASVEVKPNPPALDLLGTIALENGDEAAARAFWLAEWRLGHGGENLRGNLAKVGVVDPDNWPQENAK